MTRKWRFSWTKNSTWKLAVIVPVLVGGFLVGKPLWSSANPIASPRTETTVATCRVDREDLAKELAVQAEFRPYQEVDLHAKIAGFLEEIRVDIGDSVQAGQLLARLEIPELEEDLRRAEAVQKRNEEEVRHAEAAFQETHLSYSRLAAVDKQQPRLIAQQDLDIAQAKDRAAESTLASARQQIAVAQADVNKLKAMLKYSQIAAPFSGVITRRYADRGALIQAGTSSSTQAMPLVRLSEISRLRVVFPISMSYVERVRLGNPVEIRVQNGHRVLQATIARITHQIERSTRTMDVEVDIDNKDLALIPGMYATAVLKLEQRAKSLALPTQAVSRQGSPSVFLVNSNSELEERKVTLGLETASKVEILTGLHENDLVMIGSRTQVKPGQKVRIKMAEMQTD